MGNPPEDLERIRWGNATALITGTLGGGSGRDGAGGRLELHRPAGPAVFQPIDLHGRPEHFRPSGLCAVPSSRDPRWPGAQLLYVANSAASPATVEVFEIAGTRIVSRGNLGAVPFLDRVNGLAALADGTVYVTAFDARPGRDRPQIGGAPGQQHGIAVYHPPHRSRKRSGHWEWAVSGMDHANGLAASADGRWLLACSYFSKAVFAFARDPASGRLRGSPHRLELPLAFHPDNLKRTRVGLYELAGQRSIAGSAVNLLTGWPTSPGGAMAFRWDGRRATVEPDSPARDAAARRDRGSPSTVLREGAWLYAAHPITPGISRQPLEPSDNKPGFR